MMRVFTIRKKSWKPLLLVRGFLGLAWLVGAVVSPGWVRGEAKPVLVHYMPWFKAKPCSADWGWHWTMNHFDPDTVDASGRRELASHYTPGIGPYDNADPVVLEYHVLLMKLAGIDGVIVDWYGMDDIHDFAVNERRTLAMRDQARKAGLSFCLCYEDWTIQAAIDGGLIPEGAAISHAQETMRHVQNHYFNQPGYLRSDNGKPVLLNFGPRFFQTSQQWAMIFSALAATNQPAFYTLNHRLAIGQGAFDWPPMHLSDSNTGILPVPTLDGYLEKFEQAGRAWPAFVSSAFPRFHDIYAQAGAGASYGYLDDAGGRTFESTLARAMTNGSVFVQVVTWNDFGEGTIIEPTVEFGYRDLCAIQEARRHYLEPGFACRPADLRLARRMYDLRRVHARDPVFAAELDRAFGDIVCGDLKQADLRLTGVESTHPVICDVKWRKGRLDFSVGGYVSPAGAEVERTSSLSSPWETVGLLETGTNSPGFSAIVSPDLGASFFRVRTFAP